MIFSDKYIVIVAGMLAFGGGVAGKDMDLLDVGKRDFISLLDKRTYVGRHVPTTHSHTSWHWKV